MTPEESMTKLLRPILDVFGGTDGGMAFTRLKFDLCKQLAANPNGEAEQRILTTIARFSRLCSACLDPRELER